MGDEVEERRKHRSGRHSRRSAEVPVPVPEAAQAATTDDIPRSTSGRSSRRSRAESVAEVSATDGAEDPQALALSVAAMVEAQKQEKADREERKRKRKEAEAQAQAEAEAAAAAAEAEAEAQALAQSQALAAKEQEQAAELEKQRQKEKEEKEKAEADAAAASATAALELAQAQAKAKEEAEAAEREKAAAAQRARDAEEAEVETRRKSKAKAGADAAEAAAAAARARAKAQAEEASIQAEREKARAAAAAEAARELEQARIQAERAAGLNIAMPTDELRALLKPLSEEQRIEKEKRDYEEESSFLDSVKMAPTDNPSLALGHSEQETLYENFSIIRTFSRQLNILLPVPEIVFVGHQGNGKSSLIEAILGHSIFYPSIGTKRPVHINLINNKSCATVRCTVKRDSFLPEFDSDLDVPLGSLAEEIEKRNKPSDLPIIIQWEHHNVIDATFIDTPGLPLPEDPSFKHVMAMINQTISPKNRLIVFVRPSSSFEDYGVDLIKRVDLELERTVVVNTHFFPQLMRFQTAEAVNHYLASVPSTWKTYFVSLLPRLMREKCVGSPDDFDLKLFLSYKRDEGQLEYLKFDKKFEPLVGLPHFVNHILKHINKSFQSSAPDLLKCLRLQKVECENKLAHVKSEVESLDASKLRMIGSSYAVKILQCITSMLAGTAGQAHIHGQTLEQEKSLCGAAGQWFDNNTLPLVFDPQEWNVKLWQNKLYGGSQFERLLDEFRAVCNHTTLPEITRDDIITAAGVPQLLDIPNFTWAACELGKQKSQEAFTPLIGQVTKRASYIMKRLVDVAESEVNAQRPDRLNVGNTENFPFFVHYVKDLCYKAIESYEAMCNEKCMDEFYDTRTILLEFTMSQGLKPLSSIEEVRTVVETLFTHIKERITTNAIIKLYNYFFIQMQNTLWVEINKTIGALSDTSLEDLFHASSLKERLVAEEDRLSELIKVNGSHETSFLEASAGFSHPTAGK